MVSVWPQWWQPVRGPRDKIWDLVALVWPIRSRVITTSSALVRCWNFFWWPQCWFYWRVYIKGNSWINFIFCIVESSHAHQHCPHAWPTLIHGNSGHVAVRAGAREWYLMNRLQDARSWSACSLLLYCSMQRVMFSPCTHMSDHVHMVQSESDMIKYVSLRDWP